MKYKLLLFFIVSNLSVFGQNDIYHGMLDQRLGAYYCGKHRQVVNAEGRLKITGHNKAVYYTRYGRSFPDRIVLPKGCLDKSATQEIDFTYSVPANSRHYGSTYSGKAHFLIHKNETASIRFSGIKCVSNFPEDGSESENSIGRSKL